MPEQGDGDGWSWDPSLYAGSARYYARGRVAYPAELITAIAEVLRLDGTGRLLDVGCGPGSLTLPLAPWFAEVIGVDADAGMLAEAARLAAERGVGNAVWRRLRAEDLPADLPAVDVVTFAQSFHWLDRAQAAAAARDLLLPGGAVVHVHAATHEGSRDAEELPHPQPPREAIDGLVSRYLGPERRAGRGVRPGGIGGDEDDVYRSAGFTDAQRIEVPGRLVERDAEQIVASVYSLSYAAPHLFGDRLGAFDRDLRALLAARSADGVFSERMRPIAADVWRR